MLLYTVCCWGEFTRLPYEKKVKSWFRLAVSWINFVFLQIVFVFLSITLSNYLWNLQIKTFLLSQLLSSGKPQSFYLHINLNNLLYLYLSRISVNCTLSSCILIAFSPQIPNGWAYSTPSYPLDVGTTH